MNKSNWHEGLGSISQPALGMVELKSISCGLVLTDLLVKKAPIRMVASEPVSSGKHVLIFFGDVASVVESHRLALEQSKDELVRETLIPAIHEELVPHLESLWKCSSAQKESDVRVGDWKEQSLGIVESATMVGAVSAADRALKMARVSLVRLRLGQGIGGKAYFVLRGSQEEVEAALQSAEILLQETQSLIRKDLIARPILETWAHV